MTKDRKYFISSRQACENLQNLANKMFADRADYIFDSNKHCFNEDSAFIVKPGKKPIIVIGVANLYIPHNQLNSSDYSLTPVDITNTKNLPISFNRYLKAVEKIYYERRHLDQLKEPRECFLKQKDLIRYELEEFAMLGNISLYSQNYPDMISEIDAEKYSFFQTCLFLKECHPDLNASKIALKYFKDKILDLNSISLSPVSESFPSYQLDTVKNVEIFFEQKINTSHSGKKCIETLNVINPGGEDLLADSVIFDFLCRNEDNLLHLENTQFKKLDRNSNILKRLNDLDSFTFCVFLSLLITVLVSMFQSSLTKRNEEKFLSI